MKDFKYLTIVLIKDPMLKEHIQKFLGSGFLVLVSNTGKNAIEIMPIPVSKESN